MTVRPSGLDGSSQHSHQPCAAHLWPSTTEADIGDTLTPRQAWQRCIQQRSRLCREAARLGLPEQAEDLVHDVFLAVMALPVLRREGFDALLHTVPVRRCRAVHRHQTIAQRTERNAILRPDDQHDHADAVIHRMHARWRLDHCPDLNHTQLRMLHLLIRDHTHSSIAALTGTTHSQVTDTLRTTRTATRKRLGRASGW